MECWKSTFLFSKTWHLSQWLYVISVSSTKTTLPNNKQQNYKKRKCTQTGTQTKFLRIPQASPKLPPPSYETSEKDVLFFHHHHLTSKEDWHFVFGGDTCDKGPGSLRCLHALVSLKKRHPDRVHLLTPGRLKAKKKQVGK